MHYTAQRCRNCGEVIPHEQVRKTMQEPEWFGASFEAVGVLPNDLGLYCSSYTHEDGCAGNDPQSIAYWSTV